MDKEDCIQVLLSTLQQPLWKSCDSVTDWDLKNVLWKAGLLLAPEQVAALFADMKRRGLISARERRSEDRITALWGVKITPVGEEWIAHVRSAAISVPQMSPAREEPPTEELSTTEEGHSAQTVDLSTSAEKSDLPADDTGTAFDVDASALPSL